MNSEQKLYRLLSGTYEFMYDVPYVHTTLKTNYDPVLFETKFEVGEILFE